MEHTNHTERTINPAQFRLVDNERRRFQGAAMEKGINPETFESALQQVGVAALRMSVRTQSDADPRQFDRLIDALYSFGQIFENAPFVGYAESGKIENELTKFAGAISRDPRSERVPNDLSPEAQKAMLERVRSRDDGIDQLLRGINVSLLNLGYRLAKDNPAALTQLSNALLSFRTYLLRLTQSADQVNASVTSVRTVVAELFPGNQLRTRNGKKTTPMQ